MPTVTIGVPVYNAGRWIDQALWSLREQTHRDILIHVSDNASTDDTVARVKAHRADDDRIVLIAQRSNIGAVANFNHVAATVSSPYFKWAAADDLHAPTFVASTLALLEADPSAVLAHSRTATIDEQGHEVPSHIVPGPGLDPTSYDEHRNIGVEGGLDDPDPVVRFRRIMRELWFTPQLYGLMRTETLHATELHPHHYMGDHILLSELVLHGPFLEVDEPLFLRRIHAGQTSNESTAAARVAVNATDQRAKQDRTKVAGQYPKRLRLHAEGVGRAPISRRQAAQCRAIVAGAATTWARRKLAARRS